MNRQTLSKHSCLFAVLVVALLAGTAHAAEYGSGQHAHDGVACSFGLSFDDDACAVGRVIVAELLARPADQLPPWCSHINATPVALLPPSTGPPKTC